MQLINGDLESTFDKIYEVPTIKENKKEFQNKYVSIRIDDDGVFARDKTDEYNEPSMFTKSKRGLKDCIHYILSTYGDDRKFSDVCYACEKYGVKIHRYCAMD